MSRIQVFNKVIAVALLSALSLCAAQKEKGVYLGAGLGGTAFNDNDLVKDYNTDAGTNLKFEDTSGGFLVYGGYKFNNIVAVELAYTNYGTFELKNPADGAKLEFSPYSISASANLGYSFLDGQLRPYVLLGLSQVDLDGWVDDDKGTGIHLGLGIQYDPKSLNGLGFRLSADSDSFSVDTGVSSAPHYEDNYAQSLNVLYIGAHYLF